MTNYLHNLKTLAAAAALLTAGSAAAETATWAFTADGVVASTSGNLSAAQSITIGDKLTNKGYDTGKEATKYSIDFQGNTGGQRWAGSEFAFTLTPEADFSIKIISVDLMNSGWGDGRYDVEISCNGAATLVCQTIQPVRDNAADTSVKVRTAKYTLENPVVVAAGTECTVTLHYYSRNAQTSRNMFIGSVALTDGADEPVGPAYDGEAVPMAAGVFYNLSKGATNQSASFQGNNESEYVGNTGAQTWVEYPFYNEEAGNFMFYFAGGSKGIESQLGVYLDGADEENLVGVASIENTDSWTNFKCVNLVHLGELEPGQHSVRVKVLDHTGSYAGNWKVAIYEAGHFTDSFNAAYGEFSGGARSENGGENVGNIRNGATAKHHLYVAEDGKYDLQWSVRYYGEAICHITIPEDNIAVDYVITDATTESAPERALGSAYKPATVELGTLTAGTKTLNLAFEADHTGYIANYGAIQLAPNNGSQTGIESVAVEAEQAVEYYNLQGVRVADNARGILIRVATDANGVRTATKTVR